MEDLQQTSLEEIPKMMTYNVRPGIIDTGKYYELKVTALLSLKCLLKSDEDMWIATNVPDAGYFDDIVLRLGEMTYLIQVKHKQNARVILRQELTSNKGDFCLAKYFKGIAEVRESLNNRNEHHQFKNYLSTFDNIHFIIFTNRNIDDYEFLLKINEYFLNTTFNGKMHKVNTTKIDTPIINNMGFDNFYFISNQISVQSIDEEIEKEFTKVSDCFNLPRSNIVNIAENYTKFIVNWSEGKLGCHFLLTRTAILQKIAELFLKRYTVLLHNKPFEFYTDSKKLVWNQLVKDKTATIVKYDKSTAKFVKEYIGNEVHTRCPSYHSSRDMLWGSSFIERTTLFSDEFKHSKWHLHEITRSRNFIRPIDVYKCLFMAGEVPLLVEITTTQEYEEILRILELSGYKYKVIIINRSEKNCSSKQVRCFSTLSDLKETDRKLILTSEVSLQGRLFSTVLEKVDESMLQCIDTNDIINILCNNFNVGNNLTPMLDDFVQRTIFKIFIESEAVDILNDEIFIIKGGPDKYHHMGKDNVFKWEDLKLNSTTNRKQVNGKMCCSLANIHESFPGQPVHIVTVFSSHYFEWESSHGSTKRIKKFVANLDKGEELDIQKILSSNMTILSGAPGMGKSTAIAYLAYKIPTDKWVVKVDLGSHIDYCENYRDSKTVHKPSDHLACFNNSASQSEFANAVFTKFQSSKDVVLLLDGFDEVSVLHQKIVLRIAKSLYKEGYHIVITTRPHMAPLLEREFNTLSTVLKPFSHNDQMRYLLKRFSLNHGEANLKPFTIRFISELLKACKNCFDDNFTGVPLQIKLLSEVCLQDYKEDSTVAKINFDAVDLYEKFINKKIDVICQKVQDSSSRDVFKLYKSDLSLLALKHLFPMHEENILKIRKLHGNDEHGEIMQLEKVGTFMLDQSFIHRTFSEYLAGQWLAKNLEMHDEALSEITQAVLKSRSEQKYPFLFKVFDHIASRNRSTYTSHGNDVIL